MKAGSADWRKPDPVLIAMKNRRKYLQETTSGDSD
jgi:hypothetical protein